MSLTAPMAEPEPDFTARPLITAYEAYPELERQFLSAQTEIWAGFRIFDLSTLLRSPEGRAIGKTWLDLIVHRLRAGVAIHFVLADFDAALATPLHRGTWRSVRQFTIARELAGPCQLNLLPVRHTARAGFAPRLLFWPLILRRVRRHLRELDAEPLSDRERKLAHSVGLKPWLDPKPNGRLRPSPMPHIYPATHHQKFAIFDKARLFIGGLDLDERRYDDPDHRRPAEQTWHDVSVVTEGREAVAAAQAHLESLWGLVPVAPPQTSGEPIFVRTLSRPSRNPLHLSPRQLLRENEQAYLDTFASARQLIYIEAQFFRHRATAQALARLARTNRDLSLIMMLPAAPENVAFEGATGLDARFGEYLQAWCVRTVRRAFGPRAFIGMPLRPVANETEDRDTALGSDIVYIHAKVAVGDDTRALVTSANLNGRSLRWDTEAGVILRDPPTVSLLRRRLFEHWLPADASEDFFAPATAASAWSKLARANAALPPRRRRGFIVPFDIRPAEDFGQPVPLMPEEIV